MARVVVPGVAHHVTQRGNYRQDVFTSEEHKQRYLELLEAYASRYAMQVRAYCLMSNHVHFVVVPERADSMALCFGRTHMRYEQWLNGQRHSHGHLWQTVFSRVRWTCSGSTRPCDTWS